MAELVTIIMANYNGSPYLDKSVKSVLNQTYKFWELIIIDDNSNDESVKIIEEFQASDSRIRLFAQSLNLGPASARNVGLKEARGAWIAILDSDDLMDSRRIEHLIAKAASTGAGIVADNMIVFYDANEHQPHLFLREKLDRQGRFVETSEYVASLALYTRREQLGFLKPMIRASDLNDRNISYDETLKIGEDSDLIFRCLLGGMTMYVSNDVGYIYRKRNSSISHRLSVDYINAMIDAQNRNYLLNLDFEITNSIKKVTKSYKTALSFEVAVSAIKRHDYRSAAAEIARAPQSARLFLLPLIAKLGRLIKRAPLAPASVDKSEKKIVLLSRQRLIGNTNGSSSYILSLANGLKAAGYKIQLVQPSPLVFGRWPILFLKTEMSVFESHCIRQGLKIGRLFICLRTSAWVNAFLGITALIARNFGIEQGIFRNAPAPYAIGAAFTNDDLLYVSRSIPPAPFLALTDYCFQNLLLPYALRQTASAVVMHDLFSARKQHFSSGEKDGVTDLAEAEELALLSLADIVVAIQADEAAHIEGALTSTQVVVAPMGTTSVGAPQPGGGMELLFVASGAAPNIIGLRWFLKSVWPRILGETPDVRLSVAGNISRAFDDRPAGVSFLGVVDDLQPLYSRASVVISPLTAGSGLKIKLIEGMAAGKAIVATPVTLQGVESLVKDAVVEAFSAEDFAKAVVLFLESDALRLDYGARALCVADAHFGVEASSRSLIQAFHDRGL